jgi:hypothetical protein
VQAITNLEKGVEVGIAELASRSFLLAVGVARFTLGILGLTRFHRGISQFVCDLKEKLVRKFQK